MLSRGCRIAALAVGAGLSVLTAAHGGNSTLQNPTVTFSSPGPKLVTLVACNAEGCTETVQTVIVLDPAPSIVSASVLIASPEVGQLVPFAAAGTGQPELTYSWSVWSGLEQVATLTGAAPFWDTRDAAPGLYTAVLRLANAAGTVDSLPIPILLGANSAIEYFSITPCRIVDTRETGGALAAGVPRLLPRLDHTCVIPPFARAIAANVTAVGATGVGSIHVYPSNYPTPVISGQVVFKANSTRAAFAVIPLSTDGQGSLRAVAQLGAGEAVHLVLDVSGYFAPPQ